MAYGSQSGLGEHAGLTSQFPRPPKPQNYVSDWAAAEGVGKTYHVNLGGA